MALNRIGAAKRDEIDGHAAGCVDRLPSTSKIGVILRVKSERRIRRHVVGKLRHYLTDLLRKQQGDREARDTVARIPIHLGQREYFP